MGRGPPRRDGTPGLGERCYDRHMASASREPDPLAAELRLTLPGVADEAALKDWLAAFLRDHLADWSEAFGPRWGDEAVRAHLQRHGLVQREYRELVRAAQHPDGYVRVGRVDARPVSVVYAEVRQDRYLCAPMGVLSWIYSDPSVRGRGIGAQMLAAADAWFSWRGVCAREVFVTRANAGAVRLYERHGYRVIDHRLIGPPLEATSG